MAKLPLKQYLSGSKAKQVAKTVGLIATIGFSGLLAYTLYKKIKAGVDFDLDWDDVSKDYEG